MGQAQTTPKPAYIRALLSLPSSPSPPAVTKWFERLQMTEAVGHSITLCSYTADYRTSKRTNRKTEIFHSNAPPIQCNANRQSVGELQSHSLSPIICFRGGNPSPGGRSRPWGTPYPEHPPYRDLRSGAVLHFSARCEFRETRALSSKLPSGPSSSQVRHNLPDQSN